MATARKAILSALIAAQLVLPAGANPGPGVSPPWHAPNDQIGSFVESDVVQIFRFGANVTGDDFFLIANGRTTDNTPATGASAGGVTLVRKGVFTGFSWSTSVAGVGVQWTLHVGATAHTFNQTDSLTTGSISLPNYAGAVGDLVYLECEENGTTSPAQVNAWVRYDAETPAGAIVQFGSDEVSTNEYFTTTRSSIDGTAGSTDNAPRSALPIPFACRIGRVGYTTRTGASDTDFTLKVGSTSVTINLSAANGYSTEAEGTVVSPFDLLRVQFAAGTGPNETNVTVELVGLRPAPDQRTGVLYVFGGTGATDGNFQLAQNNENTANATSANTTRVVSLVDGFIDVGGWLVTTTTTTTTWVIWLDAGNSGTGFVRTSGSSTGYANLSPSVDLDIDIGSVIELEKDSGTNQGASVILVYVQR